MAKRKELKPLENVTGGVIFFIHTPRKYEASAPSFGEVEDTSESTATVARRPKDRRPPMRKVGKAAKKR